MALRGTGKILNFSEGLLTRTRASGKFVPMDLNEVVRGFVDFIKVLPKFKRNHIGLCLHPEIPLVQLDVDQFQQVLLNLMNNAVESFPEAALDLETRYDTSRRIVELSVKDNGPGIEESVREKLLTHRVTTKPQGHGYGLPICRKIVEDHGGSIRIESSKTTGTRFVLTFPEQQEQQA